RLLGMIIALFIIWVGFDLMTDGRFLTPRNLFNLSVQTASVAIMATGMVFVIVLRNIDLSVGAMLGVIAMVMGVVQTEIIPAWLGFNHPATWVITISVGVGLGAIIGAVQGYVIAYLAVPAFIVTLGGLLVWRGAAWWVTTGRTVAPLDKNFVLLGGGVEGTLGAPLSWLVGAVAIVLVVVMLALARRQRHRYGFPLKPIWAEVTIGGMFALLIAGFVWVMNIYPVPIRAARRIYAAKGLDIPPDGIDLTHGIAIPVVVLVIVAIVITFIARRTRFGRFIFATGGNPDAAALAGINTKWLTMQVFMLMGVLCAIGAVVASARLRSAANDLGTLDELRVIAAAVIGGTSLSGGIGTIYGAVLGAVVMQSLQSGMALVGVDTSLQSIIIGIVLVVAVWADQLYRRGTDD
ncbi:MAG: sugar ABC transporter permease, partial [Alphaproteobacteria bacterium]